jgi:hypothetical protein
MNSAHDEKISFCPASAGSAQSGQCRKSKRMAEVSCTIWIDIVVGRSSWSATSVRAISADGSICIRSSWMVESMNVDAMSTAGAVS